MSSRGRLVGTFLAVVSVVGLDQSTKWWAVDRLVEGRCTPETCIDVIGSLRFHLHYNFGASFSTGTGFGRWFGVLAIIMSAFLIGAALRADSVRTAVLFGCIAGGAIGNLADRMFRAENGILSGGVVDFVDLQWWPIFNVADAAIVVGVFLLMLDQFLHPDAEDEGRPVGVDEASAGEPV